MLRTDLDTPLLTIPSSTSRLSSRYVRLTCSGILVISCTIFGFTQTYAQDIAEAARKEQARKDNQQKKPKHVYTDDDLKRAQILTPEDRAEVEARKGRQPLPAAVEGQESIDAQELPAELPLGDVARHYRRLREMQQLQQSVQFHLPVADEQVLAAPKASVIVAPEAPALEAPKHPVMPVHPRISIPAPPQIEPMQPSVRRSPFERPRVFLPAPPSHLPPRSTVNRATPPGPAPAIGEAPSHASTMRIPANKPAAPAPDLSVMPSPRLAPHVARVRPAAPVLRTAPSHPSTPLVTPSKPAPPTPDFSVMPSPAAAVRVTPAQPAAPAVRTTPAHPSTLSVTPAIPSVPKPDFGVMPSPAPITRVTPAQPAAPVVSTAPSHQSALPVTPSKPAAPALDLSVMPSPAPPVRVPPAQPVAPEVGTAPAKPSALGVAPSQPTAPVIPVAPSQPTAPERTAPAGPAKLNAITVQPGDSLWKLAQQNLGGGLRWHELLAANPAIVDPNHIVAGSELFLPSIASRFRTATSIIVQKGDTLSEIARTEFGHASYWSCIANANPAIHDANLIYEGQSLLLPASCKP